MNTNPEERSSNPIPRIRLGCHFPKEEKQPSNQSPVTGAGVDSERLRELDEQLDPTHENGWATMLDGKFLMVPVEATCELRALLSHITAITQAKAELEAENARLLTAYGSACSQYVDLAQVLSCNTCDVYKKASELQAALLQRDEEVRRLRELLSLWNDDLQESAGGRGMAERLGIAEALSPQGETAGGVEKGGDK